MQILNGDFFSERSQTLEQPNKVFEKHLWNLLPPLNLLLNMFLMNSSVYNFIIVQLHIITKIHPLLSRWVFGRTWTVCCHGRYLDLEQSWTMNSMLNASRKNNKKCQMQWSLRVGFEPSFYFIVQVWIRLWWQKILNIMNNPEFRYFCAHLHSKR